MSHELPENYSTLEECFGARLKDEIDQRGWSITDLREKLGKKDYSPTRVENWLAGRTVPYAKDLRHIAEVLDVPLDWLLCVNEAKLSPRVVISGEEYKAHRKRILDTCKETLWIQVRNGITTGWKRGVLTNIIREKSLSEIRVLLCPPEGESASDDEEFRNQVVRELVGTRRETREVDSVSVSNAIMETLYQVWHAAHDVGLLDIVEVRAISYVPAAVVYIIDANTKNGTAIAIQSNYRLNFEYAPLIVAKNNANSSVFKFYKDNFESLWKDGKPLDLTKYSQRTNEI